MASPKNNNDTAGLTKNDTDGHKSLGSESEDMHTTEKLLDSFWPLLGLDRTATWLKISTY
jgi:hypothetical protein